MYMSKSVAAATVAVVGVVAMAAPAFAHDCFNPSKPEGAGVNYNVVGFDADGPIFEQVGPGKGIGGFATVFGGDEVFTIGHSGAQDVVGGPGSQTPEHSCDGRGVDYRSQC
jgi:hypothetical protein